MKKVIKTKAMEDEAGKALPAQRQKKTLSHRTGLVFPAERLKRLIKQDLIAKNVGESALVAMAAAIEYFAMEVLDMTNDIMCTEEAKTKHPDVARRITPRNLKLVLGTDLEFVEFLRHTTMKRSGVVPTVGVKRRSPPKAE